MIIHNRRARTFDVTHVIPYMHPSAGGPPVVVDRLCRQLLAQGWSTRVITTDTLARGKTFNWARHYRDAYELEIHPSSGPAGYAYSRRLRSRIDAIVCESQLVHIHNLWSYPNHIAMTACRRHGVPYLVMPHGMLDPYSIRRKWVKKQIYGRMIEWSNLRSAAGMVYTHAEEQRLAQSSVPGLPGGHVAPLGADTPPQVAREVLSEEFLANHPKLRNRRLVIFLGRLHEKKGLDLLLPAFANLTQSQLNAHLLLVGKGEEAYVNRLHKQIAGFKIEDRVTLTGPLEGRSKWQALAAGCVLALPSYQENFALVVVEALASGLPVVLSRRVNIWPEVVASGAGLVCDLKPASIASELARFTSDTDLCLHAGRQGRQLVDEQFTWQNCAQRLEAVYRDLISARHDQGRQAPLRSQ